MISPWWSHPHCMNRTYCGPGCAWQWSSVHIMHFYSLCTSTASTCSVGVFTDYQTVIRALIISFEKYCNQHIQLLTKQSTQIIWKLDNMQIACCFKLSRLSKLCFSWWMPTVLKHRWFSYNFLVNDYVTSFKVNIQFDHFRSENNSEKLSLKYFEFSKK